jgi:hypothetical protein
MFGHRRNLAVTVLESEITFFHLPMERCGADLSKFILVNRGAKIRAGQRTTSFSWMVNDKNGAIGRTLRVIPEQYRETAFMGGQLRSFNYIYLPFYGSCPIFLQFMRSSRRFLPFISCTTARSGAVSSSFLFLLRASGMVVDFISKCLGASMCQHSSDALRLKGIMAYHLLLF